MNLKFSKSIKLSKPDYRTLKKLYKENQEEFVYKERYKNKYWKQRWLKLIKQDNDWDSIFLHKLILTKLKHMISYFENGNITTKETYEEMLVPLREAYECGYRAYKDEYLTEDIYDFIQKHTNPDDINSRWDSPENEDLFLKMCDKQEELRNKDLHRMFELIADNMNLWWD